MALRPNIIDITGRRFGKWSVEAYVGRSHWQCLCECGNRREVGSHDLRHGLSLQCRRCHNAQNNQLGLTNRCRPSLETGKENRLLYGVWWSMRDRCLRPDNQAFRYYGGRGITVCAEWSEFEPFLKWARSSGYAADLTIERVNNDGNYEPGNCRWATRAEQNRNKRPRLPKTQEQSSCV